MCGIDFQTLPLPRLFPPHTLKSPRRTTFPSQTIIRSPFSVNWFHLPSHFHFIQSDLIYRAIRTLFDRFLSLFPIQSSFKLQTSSSERFTSIPSSSSLTGFRHSPPFDLMINNVHDTLRLFLFLTSRFSFLSCSTYSEYLPFYELYDGFIILTSNSRWFCCCSFGVIQSNLVDRSVPSAQFTQDLQFP